MDRERRGMTAAGADRYAGCLLGQALGDALGFAVEGRSPAACRDYVEQVLETPAASPRGNAPFEFGQYTDDTQLARELARSCVARGRFDPPDYAGRIAAIFVEGRIVGRGRTTEAAALLLAAGTPWHQAGTPAPAAGNGSAMRAGPIGLLFPAEEVARARAAHDQGRITHADPRCAAGAVAIAGAVALALADEGADAADFSGRLAAWARPYDASVADAIEQLPGWLRLTPAEAAGPISKAGLQPGLSDRWAGISPFVTSSVVWSLYAYLRTPDDYWQTIRTAIAVGGDVDTTAAMAGAISGARLGLDAVPDALVQRLNDRGDWGFEALRALAGDCCRLAAAG